MKISAFNYISASLWFALCMAYFASREAQDKDQIVFLSVNLFSAVVFIVIAVLLQSIILRHYNKLYPDRSISMRSRNTQRELFDKLDEAERFTVYRSAYSSFKADNVMIYCCILFFIPVFNNFRL
ncbi:DUF3169 family protein [Paenibacillus sp. DLE-14]|uniref:DUF3169 family protein n=1 Tax=Paenibacillus lignilyticus TaxID=1172615 RepID=A0ABS5CDR7_9BACL|nr:DUF3169 family protein [Paenibacillus lignilyticus]